MIHPIQASPGNVFGLRFILKTLFVPVLVLVVLIFLSKYFLGEFAGWESPQAESQGFLIGQILPFSQFIAFGFVLSAILKIWAAILHTKPERRKLPPIALGMLKLACIASMGLIAVDQVFHQSLTFLLTATGMITVVIGVALKGIIDDFFSGIALAFDGNIRLNDWLVVTQNNVTKRAQLKAINWRSTLLVEFDQNEIVIPNSEFRSCQVVNTSAMTPFVWVYADINIDVRHDIDFVILTLQSAILKATQDGLILSEPPSKIFLRESSGGCIKYSIKHPISNDWPVGTSVTALILNVVKFFHVAGIRELTPGPSYSSVNVIESKSDDQQSKSMLLSISILSCLPASDLAELERKSVEIIVPHGFEIIRQGEAGDSMFILLEGQLKVFISVDDVMKQVGTLWPGDFFGEMSLFTGEPRSATISSLGRCRVIEIRKEFISPILSANHAAVSLIADIIDRRQKSNVQKFSALGPADNLDTAKNKSVLTRIKAFFGL